MSIGFTPGFSNSTNGLQCGDQSARCVWSKDGESLIHKEGGFQSTVLHEGS